MKHSIYLLLLWPALFFGQSANQNYVKTTVYKSATATSISNPTPAQAAVTVSYVDGLGRPSQQVAYKQSASGKDIITHIEYDGFGRQAFEYLPYARTTASLDFDANGKTNTETFYNSNVLANTGDPNFETTDNPKSQKLFEASPLDRVLKQAAPGNDWIMGQGHEIKMDYQTNAANEVMLLTATATPDSYGAYDIALNNATYYPANTLYKTITYDENSAAVPIETNGSSIEFKNTEGQVVLKRTYSVSMIGATETNTAHDTHYVYDQYGNLNYVITPLINAANTITPDMLDGLCYQYRYDNRNRMVEKKIPGKEWEYMVYDKLDRLVATGPVNSPFTDTDVTGASGWIINKYDKLSRVILTAWQPQEHEFTSTMRYDLQEAYNGLTVLSEDRSDTEITIEGIAFGYTNDALPGNFQDTFHTLTINYYDDYGFTGAPAFPAIIEGVTAFYNNTQKPKGLLTGSYVRVPSISTEAENNFSYNIYDDKGRVLRNYTTNFLGGYTYTDTRYLFDGRVDYTTNYNKRTATSTVYRVKDIFTYTDQSRVLQHTHQIGSGTENLLSYNSYTELGQLKSKKVGGTDLTAITGYYQKVDYRYNIRGWLEGINDTHTLSDYPSNDLFAFKINYNRTVASSNGLYTGQPLYNGNISETYWRSGNDNVLRKYGYFYDDLNRLKAAWYMKPGIPNEVAHSYDESLKYDKNGNIMKLLRNGYLDSDSGDTANIDNLTYTYTANTNRLARISDSTYFTNGFTDGANLANEYLYDDKGNMVSDLNKGIENITYNQLNLPTKIEIAEGITYRYDANGVKMQKTVTLDNVASTIDYLWGYQYKDGVLQFFPTAEGYVSDVLDEGADHFNYVYNYTDHLGNIRLSYSKSETGALKIMEENNYYPFGLKHENYNVQKYTYTTFGDVRVGPRTIVLEAVERMGYQYKFQGQERQDELGLNWDSFKWRNYDPAIGRFMSIDPLAEKYTYNSPYAFAENRVIDGRELEGLEWVDADGYKVYDPSANDGKGDFTNCASNDDHNLAKSLNQTETGKEQFNKLVTSEIPTTVTLDKVNTPKDEKGAFVVGETGPSENGYVKVTKRDDSGKVSDVKVKGFEIVIYEKNVNATIEKNSTGKMNAYGKPLPKGMSFSQLIGAAFGHEIEHATKKDIINRINNPNAEETPATEISNKITDETK